MSIVHVTADIRQPSTEIEATGYVTFQLLQPAVVGGVVYGTNQLVMSPVVSGQFSSPVPLETNALWQVTVQTDQWRAQFQVVVPPSPDPTTLGALFALSAATPQFPVQYIPYAQRDVPGGVATLDPSTGLVTASQLPAATALWALAEQYAGLSNPGAITDFAADPAQPLTLAAGIYQNKRFTVAQLIISHDDTKLINCDIVTTNANFGVRLDANTGLETGRYLEHCRITGAGVALAGAGFRARLCEVYNNGDDSARLGRSHAEPTVFEFCHFHDFKPVAASHTDGVQCQTIPAADIVLFGCSISMNTATGYTLPGDAGYTAAVFVDTADVPVAGGDPEPARVGNVWVDSCKLSSSQNYSVVIDGANVDVSNSMLLPGTTAIESIQAGITVTGHNNVDINGVPIVDTDIGGRSQRFVVVGDPRLTLALLGDVDLAGVADANVLAYNLAEHFWEPVAASSGGGGSSTLADLTDVNLAGLVDGKFLEFSDSLGKWIPGTPAGGGGGFTPVRVTSGPHLGDVFGGGSGGLTPTGIPPAVWQLTLPANRVAAGHLLQWSMPLISTGTDAQCDVASLAAGVPVNYYSDNYGPTQHANGHSGLYVSGDFGADQGPVIWWVVQPSDLAGDGSFTISFLFQPSGSHRWGSAGIPGQVDLVNFGPHN